MIKKIYVVDDDEGILDGFQVMLESEGYHVEISQNADMLVNLPKNKIPDLIILDILLSGQDGRDICTQLKNNPNMKRIPIIMVSAHPNAEKSVQNCGADEFLNKPFEIDDLLKKIKKYNKPTKTLV